MFEEASLDIMKGLAFFLDLGLSGHELSLVTRGRRWQVLAHANFTKYHFQIVDNEWVIGRVFPQPFRYTPWGNIGDGPESRWLFGWEREECRWKQCGLVSEVLPFAESGLQNRSFSPFVTFPYEFVSRGFFKASRKSATIPYKRGSYYYS